MKTTKILLMINLIVIILLSNFFFFELQKGKRNNSEIIKTIVNTELSKALSKTQVSVLPNNTQNLSKKNEHLDSLSYQVKNLLISKIPNSGIQDKQKDVQDKQRNASLTLAVIKAQIKNDSLENEVNQLSQLVRSNFIQATNIIQTKEMQSKAIEMKTEVQPYYNDISVVFRTRRTFITAKVEQQYFSNFQYGQVFHFDNSIPEYMSAFTDNKGAIISNDEAKIFLQQKSFWVNAIDLRDHKQIVKCVQNI